MNPTKSGTTKVFPEFLQGRPCKTDTLITVSLKRLAKTSR
jgi:hypothetical protein